MKKNNTQDERLYISFSKVVKLLNTKPHILIYWEKKIPQLKPYRIANRKFYKKEQVNLLLKVKKLLEEGYSLEGIKKALMKGEFKETSPELHSERDIKKLIKEILNELKELYKNL
ncbi:MAG: hypothetical protein C0190_03755 [Thermodesulfobacterium geofontis]|uniref:HTH merR-type domain-containing protein n=1 Tax=Thermodesulfobacterium geofontis TaxID=1295609 RepID=A0A2N7PNQ2_9BACT|nr:MAG: hypothetical protein C0190_03755 [Thermodesulfobacterium geofontis]